MKLLNANELNLVALATYAQHIKSPQLWRSNKAKPIDC